MFSVRTLNCLLQMNFLTFGTIAAIRKAITQSSKNVPADGCRLPHNNKQLKGNQKLKKLKLKKTQYGLSLIMKMVVIAIIGILAQIALSSYQEYVSHEKVAKQ
jgi:hypothetical protein